MRALVLLVGLVLGLAGCAGSPDARRVSGEVTVLAAASLTDAFEAIGDEFEADHPGTTVRFSFGGSQQLATQVIEGAPADVLASADTTQMDRVAEAGAVAGDPVPFAGNRMAIAVEPGNPTGVRGLADLADPSATVVLAAPEVPAGRYAGRLLADAGVAVSPASLETDVRGVLSKVALGEADAGIVYVSDVVAAGGDVAHVRIPDDRNVAAIYPMAALAEAADPEGARDFVAFVVSAAGQAVLAEHGFEPVP